MKEIKIIFSKDALEIYNNLKSSKLKKDIMIAKAITRKLDIIAENCQYGDSYPKNQIPKIYFSKYALTNLYRVELPMFWRMLYTLQDGATKIEIIAFILDVVDHKKYNKLHGYK
jgi:hypothetical protein